MYHLIIMKCERGFGIEQKSGKSRRKGAHEVSISKAPTRKGAVRRKQRALHDTRRGESQRREGVRERNIQREH